MRDLGTTETELFVLRGVHADAEDHFLDQQTDHWTLVYRPTGRELAAWSGRHRAGKRDGVARVAIDGGDVVAVDVAGATVARLALPRAPRALDPTELGLRAAICAAPADDTPRLVYADWLQGRADPRGEFIALDIAAVRGRADVAPRARELRERHGLQWLLDDGLPLTGDVDWWRGFASRIGVWRATAEDLAALRSSSVAGCLLGMTLDAPQVTFGELLELRDRVAPARVVSDLLRQWDE